MALDIISITVIASDIPLSKDELVKDNPKVDGTSRLILVDFGTEKSLTGPNRKMFFRSSLCPFVSFAQKHWKNSFSVPSHLHNFSRFFSFDFFRGTFLSPFNKIKDKSRLEKGGEKLKN